jgi:cation diffusion facilitator family transporter
MKSKLFIYISLVVDISIAASKFAAAAFTGSSSMLSEGVHSVIDAISQLLLIWGIRTSKKKPDASRPFGYGKELYFWSFIVSLVIFILGGCISFYEGLERLRRPASFGNPNWNYAILGVAFLFTSVSMFSAFKAFNKHRRHESFWKEVLESKDPSTFIVLLGDVGDMIGLMIAFLGVFLGRLLHNPYYDGIASMAIGVVMVSISGLLVSESKSLLMGETIARKTIRKILKMVHEDPAILKVKKHFSMYLGPEEILIQLNTVFKEDLTTVQITDAIDRLTKLIRAEFPRIKQIFVEPVK